MKLINHENSGCTFFYFDSVSSIANVQIPEINMSNWRDTIRQESKSWIGIKGGHAALREAVELAGWPEGVKKGMEVFGELTAPTLPSIRRKRVYKDYGHSINMTRIYSGSAHKAWQSSKREMTNKKMSKRGLVNLVIDFSTSCSVHGDAYFWRGALGICLASALMKSGRKVRILACMSTSRMKADGAGDTKKGERNITSALLVKDFSQPIEYNTMFAVTALSGFYRHYQFKVILSVPFRVNSYLGYPDTLKVERLNPILDDNPVVVIENIWDKETALRKAQNIVQELEQ
jgi:hypothetical protein